MWTIFPASFLFAYKTLHIDNLFFIVLMQYTAHTIYFQKTLNCFKSYISPNLEIYPGIWEPLVCDTCPV